jgi:hypothetical protein
MNIERMRNLDAAFAGAVFSITSGLLNPTVVPHAQLGASITMKLPRMALAISQYLTEGAPNRQEEISEMIQFLVSDELDGMPAAIQSLIFSQTAGENLVQECFRIERAIADTGANLTDLIKVDGVITDVSDWPLLHVHNKLDQHDYIFMVGALTIEALNPQVNGLPQTFAEQRAALVDAWKRRDPAGHLVTQVVNIGDKGVRADLVHIDDVITFDFADGKDTDLSVRARTVDLLANLSTDVLVRDTAEYTADRLMSRAFMENGICTDMPEGITAAVRAEIARPPSEFWRRTFRVVGGPLTKAESLALREKHNGPTITIPSEILTRIARDLTVVDDATGETFHVSSGVLMIDGARINGVDSSDVLNERGDAA